MTYAKYISPTSINARIPKSGHDSDGRLVIGDLSKRPDVLALLGYFPLHEDQKPAVEDGWHLEPRYRQESGQVVRGWLAVEDPPAPVPPPAVYSKLKILLAADQAGFAEELMDMIEADRKTKYIWDASNTIEDNKLLAEYLPGIAEALGQTSAELKAFLDENCLAD